MVMKKKRGTQKRWGKFPPSSRMLGEEFGRTPSPKRPLRSVITEQKSRGGGKESHHVVVDWIRFAAAVSATNTAMNRGRAAFLPASILLSSFLCQNRNRNRNRNRKWKWKRSLGSFFLSFFLVRLRGREGRRVGLSLARSANAIPTRLHLFIFLPLSGSCPVRCRGFDRKTNRPSS